MEVTPGVATEAQPSIAAFFGAPKPFDPLNKVSPTGEKPEKKSTIETTVAAMDDKKLDSIAEDKSNVNSYLNGMCKS
jgi:hypothetical protein